MAKLNISEATLRRIRDYAVNEPSFTCAFAAWDLSRTGAPITATAVKWGVEELLAKGIIELIEDMGRFGKVYAYVEPPPQMTARHNGRLFPELDASRIGELAPARGVPVPHTRWRGPSDSTGANRDRQSRGVKVRRQRQGT